MKLLALNSLKLIGVLLVLMGVHNTTFAQSSVSQVIDLEPGWNIVSTPMILDSYEFSAAETASNFDIYVLDASKPTGWATMADLGQTQFTPLFGYFINNKTGNDQTLTFNYKSNVPPNQKLFERTFTAEGWYSIGVANAEYAQSQKADRTDTNNPRSVLSLLAGKYDLVIDFTDDAFDSDRNSVALSDPWKASIPADINELNDFRDTKGYAVYVKQAGARYNGFQNEPVEEVVIPEVLTFALGTGNPNAEIVQVDEDQKTSNVKILEYTITATNVDVTIDSLKANLYTESASLESVVDSVQLRIGTDTFLLSAQGISSTEADFTFPVNGQIIVPEGEFVTVELSVSLNAQSGNYANGQLIQAKVTSNHVDETVASGLDGFLDEDRLNGSAVGNVFTLLASGLFVPADFSWSVSTQGQNDTVGIFELEFEVTAVEDDYYITDNSSVTTNNPSDGIGFILEGPSSANVASTISSTADESTSGVFTIREGETETITLRVTVDPTISSLYRVTLGEIWFSKVPNGTTATEKYVPFPSSDFRTDFENINAN